jgi:hypothetical protein
MAMTQTNYRPNPFHVLGLPVDASNEEIVERSEELAQTAGTSEERDLCVWARGELITHPRTRRRHESTEPRHTDYERERRWEDFARAYRRSPATGRGSADSRLLPEDFDLAAVVRVLARWLVEAEPDGLGPLFHAMPTAADGVPGLEVRDVLFG